MSVRLQKKKTCTSRYLSLYVYIYTVFCRKMAVLFQVTGWAGGTKLGRGGSVEGCTGTGRPLFVVVKKAAEI